LHDPFTSDPLMYAIGPFATNALLNGRVGIAAAVGVAGVLAKEFAAAPLYAHAVYAAIERRWPDAYRSLAAGNAAFLTWSALPIAAVFCYVQQPDRALWNFHYLVAPLAAVALERSSTAVAAAFVAAFAIGNLRLGAQLPIAPIARVAIAGSVVLAVAATVAAA